MRKGAAENERQPRMLAAQAPRIDLVAVDDQTRPGSGGLYSVVVVDVPCLCWTLGVGRWLLDVCLCDRVCHAYGDHVHAATLLSIHWYNSHSSCLRNVLCIM